MAHEDDTQVQRGVLLAVGGVVGLIGMVTETHWLIYSALALLAVGMILAMIRRIKLRKKEW